MNGDIDDSTYKGLEIMKYLKIRFFLLAVGFVISGCSKLEEISKQNWEAAVKNDLMGQMVGSWTFAGPEEFEKITMVEQGVKNGSMYYLVDMKLKDINTYKRYSMRAILWYTKFSKDGEWTFLYVQGLSMKER